MAIPQAISASTSARTYLPLANCEKCGLCPAPYKRPPLPLAGVGPAEPSLVVVGEAPGEFELRNGEPFTGPSGQLLWRTLSPAEVRHRPPLIYATNALMCMPEDGKQVTSKNLAACRPRLLAELHALKGVRVILLAGAKAAEAMLGHKVAITKMNGHAEWSAEFACWLVYSYHPAAVLHHAERYPDFKYACRVARECLTREPEPVPAGTGITKFVAQSTADVHKVVTALAGEPNIVCDLETTGLDPMADTVLEVGLCASDTHAFIVPAELLDDLEAYYLIKDLLQDRERVWIYHNGKFDTNMLRGAVDIDARIGADTLLLHHALDERGGGEEGGHHDLKSLATKYFNAPQYDKDIDSTNMAAVPPEERREYQAHDLCYTWRLYWRLRELLEAEPPSREGYPTPAQAHDRWIVNVANAVADVELRGIKLDMTRWMSLCADYNARIDATAHKIRQYLEKPQFNPNSTPQVLDILVSMNYPVLNSARKEVLHELQEYDRVSGKPEEPFLRDVLQYRSLRHVNNTYLIGLGDRTLYRGVSDVGWDQRIRTHLSMHGTGTGRLASRDPNLQNIPKDSPIREMFVPTEGYTFVEADYRQLEVRVLAWYSRDPQLMAAVGEKDVHWATASRVWPVLARNMLAYQDNLEELENLCLHNAMFDEFWQRQRGPNRTESASELFGWMVTRIRRQGKYVTFGIMYGEQADSLSKGEKGLGVSKYEAQKYIDNWRHTYAIAWDWLERQAAYAESTRWVESASGRRRRFAYPNSLSHVANEAMNFPIQSFASDANLLALARLNATLRQRELGYVLLPVHDSQLFEIVTERLGEGKQLIEDIMAGVLADPELTFGVDIKTGATWAGLH